MNRITKTTGKAESPLVSVVIASWNRKDDLRFVLQKLDAQDYRPLEIIVVDNNSSDGTRAMLKKEFTRVNSIFLRKNIGVTAYNTGAAASKGKYAVFLDDDSYPSPESIGLMVEAFESDPKTGVVSFDFRNHGSFSAHKKAAAVKTDATGVETYAFSGGGAGIRREILVLEKGYPEEFFIYWNELDLSIRIMQRGYKIKHFANIPAWHMASNVSRSGETAAYYHVRNLVWIYAKYFPPDHACENIRLMLELSLFFLAARGEGVYIRAWKDAVAALPGVKRNETPPEILAKIKISPALAFVPVKDPPRINEAASHRALKRAGRCLIIRSSNLQHVAGIPSRLKEINPEIEVHILTGARAKQSIRAIHNIDKVVEYPFDADFSADHVSRIKWPDSNEEYDAVVIPFAAPDMHGYENVVEFALSLSGAPSLVFCNSSGSFEFVSSARTKRRLKKSQALRSSARSISMAAFPMIKLWFQSSAKK